MDDERSPDDPRLTPISLRRELIADGWKDGALQRQVRAGVWAKPRQGAYVDGEAWRALDRDGRHEVTARAVLRQARTALALSHASGVPLHGGPTWGVDLSEVHVTRLDAKTGRAESGVHQHSGRLLHDDVVQRHGVDVIAPARNALEIAASYGTEVGLVVANDYLHRGLMTAAQLRHRYDAGFERWPRSLGTEVVIRLATPLIESVGESRFLYLCYAHRLPAPQPQYRVHRPDGTLLAILDFAWPALGAFVEFDGKVKYQKPMRPGEEPSDVVFREKRREDEVRELTGFRGIRVVWSDLERPHHTAARVRCLLEPGVRSAG